MTLDRKPFFIEENLELLTRDDLIKIIEWTLNDLYNWSNAKEARDGVSGFAAMLHEAVEYQILKAVSIHNNSEEQ